MNKRAAPGVEQMGRDLSGRIRRAQAGDVEAFAEAFESLRPTVFAIACRLVGPDDAEDAVMETYLKAWQGIPRFDRRSSLKTWLYRIANNCALDMLRARQRRPERAVPAGDSDRDFSAEAADESQTLPDESAARSEVVARVREALRRLPPESRTTLELRYADGLAYGEIAAATAVSIGTVMSRLFYGKRKLRKILETEAG